MYELNEQERANQDTAVAILADPARHPRQPVHPDVYAWSAFEAVQHAVDRVQERRREPVD